MKTKSLYKNKYKYTKESNQISQELFNVILPIIKHYNNLGYDVKDLCHLANKTVFDVEVELITEYFGIKD